MLRIPLTPKFHRNFPMQRGEVELRMRRASSGSMGAGRFVRDEDG
jgi:hypothetical protein